jgi:hypothetical protein
MKKSADAAIEAAVAAKKSADIAAAIQRPFTSESWELAPRLADTSQQFRSPRNEPKREQGSNPQQSLAGK